MTRMVDIGDKMAVKRIAVARGFLVLKSGTSRAVSAGKVKKGDVLTVSKLVGIQAAKATAAMLPLCHQIQLTSVEIDIDVEDAGLLAECKVSAFHKTGVEMEALVGVTAALLNAWDMVKYLEKDSSGQYPTTEITNVRVVRKSKGASGHGR